jgi:hypothetical protein
MTTTPPPGPTHATYVLDPTDAPHQSPKPIAILCSRTMGTADHQGGRSEMTVVSPRPLRPRQDAGDALRGTRLLEGAR